jgi:hypothetical protein
MGFHAATGFSSGSLSFSALTGLPSDSRQFCGVGQWTLHFLNLSA